MHLPQLRCDWGVRTSDLVVSCCTVVMFYVALREHPDGVSQEAKCSRYEDKLDVFGSVLSSGRSVFRERQVSQQPGDTSQRPGEGSARGSRVHLGGEPVHGKERGGRKVWNPPCVSACSPAAPVTPWSEPQSPHSPSQFPNKVRS